MNLFSFFAQDECGKEFCNQYFGSEGGRQSNNLAIYPFLMQIKRNLHHAANLDAPTQEDNYVVNMGRTEPKLGVDRSFGSALEDKLLKKRAQGISTDDTLFTLYSGHDTVIAPVLAGLGVYDKFCVWPRYASRIAFELWKGRVKLAGNPEANDTIHDYYVRVVYNGIDVTEYIPKCIESRDRLASNRAKYADQLQSRMTPEQAEKQSLRRKLQGELNLNTHIDYKVYKKDVNRVPYRESLENKHLCPLSVFGDQVDSLLGGKKTMTEACLQA